MRRAGARSLVLLLLLGACIRDIPEIPPPPSTSSTTSTSAPADYSTVDLPDVPGTTTTSIVMGPGRATLSGTVASPSGVVPGAQVLVERLVGDAVASVTLGTGPDGRWVLPSVLGGRYRVRGWRAPDLALTRPVLVFLEAAQKMDVPIRLDVYQGVTAVAAIAPDPPVVDDPANLVVQIATRRVDEDGIVIQEPVPDVRVELFGGAAWQVSSSNPTVANGQGRAGWEIVCREVGRQPLSVVVAGQTTVPLNVADCALTPPTTSTTPATTGTTRREDGGTSTTRRSTSSTTDRDGRGTTSTTRAGTTTSRSSTTTR